MPPDVVTMAENVYGRFSHARANTRLVLQESVAAFIRNQHFNTAAMLAYYGFLSLIPLLLLVLVILSRFVLASQGAMDALTEVSQKFFPESADAALLELRTISEQRIWSLVSMVLLFWSITPLASAFRGAFRRIFTPEGVHGFWMSKVRDGAGALVLLGLFLLVVVGRIVYGALAHRFGAYFTLSTDVNNLLFSFFFTLVGLFLFYLAFTPARLRWSELFSGVVVAALLLFVLRPAFSAFLRFNPNYGFAFGSLKAIFLLLTWVYLSFVIILFGAELIAGARRREVALLRGLLAGNGMTGTSAVLMERFVQRCARGETLFREGDEGHVMFYVRRGAVELRRGEQAVRTMRTGEYFGEMSMLIDTPRTATAVATAPDTELISVSRVNFDTILRENPQIAQSILRELARRLKVTNERLHPGPSVPAG